MGDRVPAEESDEGDEPRAFATGLWVAGRFKRDLEGEQDAAAARRALMAKMPRYRELRPELDLGDEAPLEEYERQSALYT